MNATLQPPREAADSVSAFGLKPSAFSFSPALARRLCELSAAAYLPGKDCGSETIENRETGTRILICESPDAIVFAFRGTCDIQNWLTDLDVLQTGYPMLDWGACRVHLGFWRAFLSVRDQLWKWIGERIPSSSILRPPSSVFFTGHSLGGALAMLGAHRFWRGIGIRPTVYTFGQPRVGNREFARCYDQDLRDRTWRVIHANDIVARIPFEMGRYWHAGREAFFGAASQPPLICPTALEHVPFDIYNFIREQCRGRFALLDDHHVNTYLECLKKG
jgi:triacylglycerol lipase